MPAPQYLSLSTSDQATLDTEMATALAASSSTLDPAGKARAAMDAVLFEAGKVINLQKALPHADQAARDLALDYLWAALRGAQHGVRVALRNNE